MTSPASFPAAVTATLGGRTLLFSADLQAVHELVAPAGLPAGATDLSPSETAAPDRGRPVLSVRSVPFAAAALGRRRRAAAIAPVGAPLRLLVGGLSVAIRFSRPSAARRAAALFSAFPTPPGRIDAATIDVARRAGAVRIAPCDEPARLFPANEWVPALKAALAGLVLRRAPYAVALHAAAVERGAGVTLICGPPGAGKTTLALALSRSGGGRVLADDLVLLLPSGMVRPVPFPAAIKPSPHGAGDAATAGRPLHKRPDGVRLRYAPLERPRADRTVDRIVMLERGAPGPDLEKADPVRGLGALLAGAHRPGERLDDAGFRALVAMLAGAECLVLRETALDRAVALLMRQDFHDPA